MSKPSTRAVEVSYSSCQKRQKHLRFKTALAKALYRRSTYLGRRLSREEFKALVAAVKRQIAPRAAKPIETRLSRLIDVVSMIERDLKVFQRPSTLFAEVELRMSIFRQQMMDLMSDEQSVSEGCSHVTKKSIVRLVEPQRLCLSSPEVGCIDVTMPASRLVLCCDSCLHRREDFVFEKFGLCLTPLSKGHNMLVEAAVLPRELEGVPPLSLQPVWSGFLDSVYSRGEKKKSGNGRNPKVGVQTLGPRILNKTK